MVTKLTTWTIIFVGLNHLSSSASGQYIHFFYPDEEGNPTAVYYSGNADWLVAQEDEKSQLHQFPSLVQLRLVHHEITYEELRYVASLKQIDDLTIGECPESADVDRRTLQLVGKMTWLELLSICINDLRDDDLEFLPELKNLLMLSIGGWPNDEEKRPVLSDKTIDIISSIKTLELVYLPAGDYSEQAFRKLLEFPKLSWLSIHSEQFTDQTLKWISTMPHLEILTINSPKFTDAGILALGQSPSLKSIDIESPLLTRKSLNILKELPDLRVFRVPLSGVDETDLPLVSHLEHLKYVNFGRDPGSIRLNKAVEQLIESRAASNSPDGSSTESVEP